MYSGIREYQHGAQGSFLAAVIRTVTPFSIFGSTLFPVASEHDTRNIDRSRSITRFEYCMQLLTFSLDRLGLPQRSAAFGDLALFTCWISNVSLLCKVRD